METVNVLCPASSSSRSDHRFCHRKALEGTKGGEGQAAWEEGGAIYIFGELELKMARLFLLFFSFVILRCLLRRRIHNTQHGSNLKPDPKN